MPAPRGGTRTSAGDRIHKLRPPASKKARAAQMLQATRPLIMSGVADAGGYRRGDGRPKYRKGPGRPKRPTPTTPGGGRGRRPPRRGRSPTLGSLLKKMGC